jgi:heterodisulfide reductase subunit A2
VQKISGTAGNFEVELLQHPRYVDMEKCIACGECAEKCPKKVTDTFNAGLATRKSIYVEYPQAVPLKYAIDAKSCIYLKNGKCGFCAKVCPTKAINFDDKPKALTIQVGSVVLAPGFSAFDPQKLDNYQYSQYKNVITSLEMERILSATGPYGGHLVRPSDHREPKKIAWLQCIGSRDINRCDHGYCSSVCCMYAVKEAVIAKEHSPEPLDTAIFYMDMRTYGKEFESYYKRAEDEKGVRFVRTRVHTIVEDRDTQDLLLRYVDESGKNLDERFDMVVLSVGMETSKELAALAGRLEIELNADNFAKTDCFTPVTTSRAGIYVCGAFQEPKDIPYSVMEASAAACMAEKDLAASRNTLTRTKTFPAERQVEAEEARIGVFVCNCGTNIGGIVNVPEVAEMARSLPGVTYVEENLFTCSQDSQEKIKEIIEKKGLNRVVVAACTPRTHEALFQETLRDAGLNKYLFEMANIRNQCSWVHSKEKDAATAKAKDLVRMAVARTRLITSLGQPTIGVEPSALVIGGGVAGMTSALGLADQGYQVYLIEREGQLGGNALSLLSTWKGEKIPQQLAAMSQRVEGHERIAVYKQATVKASSGFIGNFETIIASAEGDKTLRHGAVVVATGAAELQPQEYLFGRDQRVLTHLQLDRAVATGDPRLAAANSVAFIQCVGSREEERPYCSKVCCTHSVKAAIRFKEGNPQCQVFVIYRDIRTYGQREYLYKEAREKGVIFIRYDLAEKPVVSDGGDALSIVVRDHVIGRKIDIRADLLILAAAIVPRDNEALAQMFKLSCNSDKFFNEAHAKLRPVEFATAGIFLAGMAHYPKPIEESIAQAAAAASRAAVTLSKESITVEGVVSQVQQFMCRGCGECQKACPFNAIAVQEVEEGLLAAVVKEALCKGCGMCAVACPTGAASVRHYGDRSLMTMVETVFAAEA